MAIFMQNHNVTYYLKKLEMTYIPTIGNGHIDYDRVNNSIFKLKDIDIYMCIDVYRYIYVTYVCIYIYLE